MVLTIGSLLFNEVLKIPCCNLDKYTAEKLKKQEKLLDGEDSESVRRSAIAPDYVATSPASYDVSKVRNRLLAQQQEKERGKGSQFQIEYDPV